MPPPDGTPCSCAPFTEALNWMAYDAAGTGVDAFKNQEAAKTANSGFPQVSINCSPS
jgi:hypothetical protein